MNEKGLLLVVDDEEPIRDMLSRHFRFQGFKVLMAENGCEALKILDQFPVDVVITDIQMPLMDGVDLMRELRDQFPTLHFLVITGHVRMESLLAAIRYGADNCLFKPLNDLTELEESVEQAIFQKRRWQVKLRELQGLGGGKA